MSQNMKTARPTITLAKIQKKSNCLPTPNFSLKGGKGGKGGLGSKAVEVSGQCEPTEGNPIRQHHKLAGA